MEEAIQKIALKNVQSRSSWGRRDRDKAVERLSDSLEALRLPDLLLET